MNKLRRVVAVSALFLAPLLAPLMLTVQSAHAAVDTCTWTGTTDTAWATATNWTGCDNGNVPENGDTLAFPQTASNKGMNNNVVGLQPRFITISGTGYTFGGNAITVTGATGGFTATESATVNIGITFGGTNSNNSISSTKTLTFAQPVVFALSGGAFWLNGGTAQFNGAITGSAGTMFRASDANTTVSVNATGNTYTSTRVGAESDGIFDCNSATCFGAAANIMYMGGGVVNLRAAATYANPIETSALTAFNSWLRAFQDVVLSGATTIVDAIGISQGGTGTKTLQFTNTMDIASGSSVSFLGTDSTNSIIRVNGILSGTTGAVSVGSVFVELTGVNTYTGATTVNSGGIVSAESATALGTSAGATSVLSGGSVVFDAASGVTSTEPFTIAGTGVATKGALYAIANNVTKLNGNITLTADSLIGQRSTNCTGAPTLQLNGIIGGTGNLMTEVIQNSCRMIIGDTAVAAGANTFSGTLTHIAGFLDLNKDVAVPHNAILAPTNGAISTVITLLATGTNNLVGGTLSTISNNNATDAWNVLNSETFSEISSTTGLDGLNLCKSQTLTLNQSTDTTFNGAFGLTAGCVGADPLFVKLGTGTLWLTRDKAVGAMNFMVTAGTLSVNANFSDAAFTVNGGTLKGIATLGAVTGTSGRYAAGNSPGCTTVASLTLSAGFNFDEEIGGSTPCTDYDRTIVTGTATLGNAILNVSHYLGFTPTIGNTFTFMRAGSVSGTFNGLANGATFTLGDTTYRINYTATTVTLTAVSAALANTGTSVVTSTLFGVAVIVVAASASMVVKRKNV